MPIASELSPEPVRAAMLIAEGDASEEEAQRAVISVGWIESERNRARERGREYEAPINSGGVLTIECVRYPIME